MPLPLFTGVMASNNRNKDNNSQQLEVENDEERLLRISALLVFFPSPLLGGDSYIPEETAGALLSTVDSRNLQSSQRLSLDTIPTLPSQPQQAAGPEPSSTAEREYKP